MTTLAQTRAALLAMFNSVPDIGRVHDFERYVRLQSEMAEKYIWTPPDGGVPHLRGWQFSNRSGEERTLGLGRKLAKDGWVARGYLAFNDEAESEKVLDELAEAVRATFRADPTLGGVCSAEAAGNGPDGMQKPDSGPVLFCGVLCNSVVLQWETWRYS